MISQHCIYRCINFRPYSLEREIILIIVDKISPD